MLAGFERRQVVFIVRLRGGQVEDQVDVRIGDDLCARGVCPGDAMLRGLALCLLQAARGAGDDLDCVVFFQVVQVDVTDIADANDADADFFHAMTTPFLPARSSAAPSVLSSALSYRICR